MTPLTFRMAQHVESDEITLLPIADPVIHTKAWQELSAAMQREPQIFPVTAAELQTRWAERRAVCLLHDDEIICYTSLVAHYDANIRNALSRQLGLSARALPRIVCYEAMSAWMKPEWRRRVRIQTLAHHLFGDISRADAEAVMVMITSSLAPSIVASRMGWTLANWSKYPFATSLYGWLEGHWFYTPGWGYSRHQTDVYCGEHLSGEALRTHDWNSYQHFWVHDEVNVRHLEAGLRHALGGHIEQWRDALRIRGVAL